MKTCKTVTFTNLKGEVVTGPNNISFDLVSNYGYSEEVADKLVEDIVNVTARGQYGFGTWLASHDLGDTGVNPYVDNNGFPTGQSVVDYIKFLNNQVKELGNQIIFPNFEIDPILSLEVLQAYTPIFFAKLQKSGITFNHLLNGQTVSQEIYKESFDSLLEDLDIYRESAELNEETAKQEQLENLIKGIQETPYFLSVAFNKFLATFDLQAAEQRYAVSESITEDSEIVEEGKTNTFDNEELDDINEESDLTVSKDSTFYDSNLRVNFKTQAPKAIRMMFATMMDVEVELKNPNLEKATYSREDFEVYALTDGLTGLTKIAQSNALISLVHNVLADVEPNIDSQIAALKAQADVFFMDKATAHLGARLDNIIKRIDTYTKGSKLKSEIEALSTNPPKSLNDISDIFYRELLRTQWVQQFSKTNNRYYSTLYKTATREQGNILNRYNLNNQRIQNRIINNWNAKLNANIANAGGIEAFVKELQGFKKQMKGKKASEVNKQLLAMLGIDLPNSDFYQTIDLDGQEVFNKTNALAEIAKKLYAYGTNGATAVQNLYNFSKENPVRNALRKFALLVGQYTTKEIDLATFNMDGELVYSIGLHHSMSLTTAKYNKYLSNLSKYADKTQEAKIKQLENDLNVDYNLQVQAPSMLLSQIIAEDLSLVMNIENGLGKENTTENVSTRKLNPVDKLILDMNTVANNAIPLLQAGDRPVYMSLGVINKVAVPKSLLATTVSVQNSRIKNAIRYEILQSRKYFNEGIGKGLKNVNHDTFRMFKSLEAKLGMSMEDITKQKLAKPITNYNQSASVFEDAAMEQLVNEYIEELVNKNFDDIVNNTLVPFQINWKTSPMFMFLNQMYKKDREEAFKSFIRTQLANYTDQVRLFTGDASLFKDASDFAKRYMTLNSTKKIQRIDASMNALIGLTQKMPSFENKDKGTNAAWRAYAENMITEGRTPTITIKEPVTQMDSSTFESFVKYTAQFYEKIEGAKITPEQAEQIARKKLEPYNQEYEFADGIGYISFDAYRRLALRSATWSKYHENIYQAVLNNRPISKNDLMNARITPLKLQYSGPYMTQAHKGGGFVAVRKYGVMPLIPGVVKENTAMHNLMTFMHKNKIEQAIMESGSKVTYGKTYSIENVEEEFNQAIAEDMYSATDDLHNNYLGIQTNLNEQPKTRTRQSKQMRRHSLLNVKEGGLSIVSEEVNDLVEQYDNLHSQLVKEKLNTFMQDMGIEEVDNLSTWSKADLTNFVNQAIAGAKKRNYPTSVIQTIKRLKEIDSETQEREITFLDELPVFEELQYLITKIFKDNVASIYRNGESYMQVPDLGNADLGTTSNRTLNFYRITADNKVLPMEVKIPLPDNLFEYVSDKYGNGKFTQEALDKFNEAVRRDEEKFVESGGTKMTTLTKIRRIVGFRIPHQAKSFTETAHIVEYTNPLLTNSITVPHELVVKNNSDFDSDKFSTYQTEFEYKDNKLVINEESTNNKLLDIEYKLNLDITNFPEHIVPANDNMLVDVANKLAALKGIDLTKEPIENLLSIQKQIESFTKYKEGKSNVGISVSNISLLPVLNNDVFMAESKYGGFTSLLFEGQAISNVHSVNISGHTVEGPNGVSMLKSQVLDEITTAALDSKTGYPYYINLYDQGLQAALAGIHAGSFLRTMLFINQPVITEYLKQRSLHTKGVSSAKKGKRTEIVNFALSKIAVDANQKKNLQMLFTESFDVFDLNVNLNNQLSTITNADLQLAIKDPTSAKGSMIQVAALKVFFDLLEINSQIFDIKKQTSSDDTQYKTFAELQTKAEELGMSYYKTYDFIETLTNGVKTFSNKMQTTLISSYFKIPFIDMQKTLQKKDWTLRGKTGNKLFNAFRSEFVPIAMSKSMLGDAGFDFNGELKRLATGENSLARQLFEIQNDPDNFYYDDSFLNQFQPMINYQGSGYDIIMPKRMDNNPVDKNILDIKHNELSKNEEMAEFARDLIRLSLVQSGFLKTQYNLMPYLNMQLVHQEVFPHINFLKEMVLSDNFDLMARIKQMYFTGFMYNYVHNMPISTNTTRTYNRNLKHITMLPEEGKKVFVARDADFDLGNGKLTYYTTSSSKFTKSMRMNAEKRELDRTQQTKIKIIDRKAINKGQELKKKCK